MAASPSSLRLLVRELAERWGGGVDICPQPARRVWLETPALRGLRNPCFYDFPKDHDYFNQIAHWDQKKLGFKEQKKNPFALLTNIPA